MFIYTISTCILVLCRNQYTIQRRVPLSGWSTIPCSSASMTPKTAKPKTATCMVLLYWKFNTSVFYLCLLLNETRLLIVLTCFQNKRVRILHILVSTLRFNASHRHATIIGDKQTKNLATWKLAPPKLALVIPLQFFCGNILSEESSSRVHGLLQLFVALYKYCR